MKGTGEQQKYLERRLVEERHFRVEGDLYSTFLKGKRRELQSQEVSTEQRLSIFLKHCVIDGK